jgi:hypothetical protein
LELAKAFLKDRFIDQAAAVAPHVAAPITSAERFSPLRPPGIRTSDQRSNQAQEFLLLWPAAGSDKQGSNLDISDLATGRKIGLVPHEYPIRIRIDGERPPITVGAVVNLSRPNDHANCSMRPLLKL